MNRQEKINRQEKMNREEYQELIGRIRHYNEVYEAGESEISDYEYDQLMLQLKQAEKMNPEWVRPDSPTQVVVLPSEVVFVAICLRSGL